MTQLSLALVGFGNVGQAFARLLLRKQEQLAQAYDLTFTVTGIATGRHGQGRRGGNDRGEGDRPPWRSGRSAIQCGRAEAGPSAQPTAAGSDTDIRQESRHGRT